MAHISRRDLLLLLIGTRADGQPSDSVGGTTRLQKYTYLLEREQSIVPSKDGFEFQAYKAGPYSRRIYDDLELLENLGFVSSEETGDATEGEATEISALSFEDLMGVSDSSDTTEGPDAYAEKHYKLTEQGLRKVRGMVDSRQYEPFVDGIRTVKSKYGRYSLNDLLYHVYTKYPEMAMESEIRSKVLGKGRR